MIKLIIIIIIKLWLNLLLWLLLGPEQSLTLEEVKKSIEDLRPIYMVLYFFYIIMIYDYYYYY